MDIFLRVVLAVLVVCGVYHIAVTVGNALRRRLSGFTATWTLFWDGKDERTLEPCLRDVFDDAEKFCVPVTRVTVRVKGLSPASAELARRLCSLRPGTVLEADDGGAGEIVSRETL